MIGKGGDDTTLEFRRLSPEWAEPLAELFEALHRTGDARYFHPHPLNADTASALSQRHGRDLYYVLTEGKRVLAYGLLRGWDEGYDIPSLGIVVLPDVRGHGIGRLFMEFLHQAARRRGAKKIRLKVYPSNSQALTLYRTLGYRFESAENGQLVGIIDL